MIQEVLGLDCLLWNQASQDLRRGAVGSQRAPHLQQAQVQHPDEVRLNAFDVPDLMLEVEVRGVAVDVE